MDAVTDYTCYKCGKKLDEDKIVWLELNCDTGEFQPENYEPLSEELSQGCFPFGKNCAAKVTKPMYIPEYGYDW